MGGFEFGNVQELHSRITLITFLAVIAFVVFFDFLVGLMEYFLSGSQLYNRMIQMIYKELMLMGLVSFTIIMVESLQKNAEVQDENYHHWIAGVEFSHILIFYLTFFFVAHAFYLMRTSLICSRKYRQRFCEKPKHLIDKVESQTEQEKVFFNLSYFPFFQDLRNRVEFHLIHFLFNETYLLCDGFNFASYLSGCFDRYALKTINRSMFTWFILMILSILNYGRILAGFGFHHCRAVYEPEAGHRLLSDPHSDTDEHYSDDANAEPHAEGDVMVSAVCPTMNVKLFVFFALLLVFYSFVLVAISRMYKLRLINRIGFKGPQDYLKFLKFAEDNKLVNQERMTGPELKKEIDDMMDADEYQSEEESEFREIGEFIIMVWNGFFDTISNALLDFKVFVLRIVRPSRLNNNKTVDSAILSRKSDVVPASSSNGNGNHSANHATDHHRNSAQTVDTDFTKDDSTKTKSHNTVSPATPGPHNNNNNNSKAASTPSAASGGMASLVAHIKQMKENDERGASQVSPPRGGGRRSSVTKKPGDNPIMDMLMQNVEAETVDPDKFLQRGNKNLASQSNDDNNNNGVPQAPSSPVATPSATIGRKSHRATVIAKSAHGGTIEKFNVEKQKSDLNLENNNNSTGAAASPKQGVAIRHQSFTIVNKLSSAAHRAKETNAAVQAAVPPKDLKPEPSKTCCGQLCQSLLAACRGNKVVDEKEADKKHGSHHHKEEENSFFDMYLFGRPILFFRAVELCIMFNCLYLAFWITNFIVICSKLDETYGWKVVGQVCMAIPIFFVVPSIGYIAETCSLLTAVSELNLEVVHAVLIETEDVNILVNELRQKMLQRISSVATKEVNKMDIIHGLFSEIDKDGSGCIDHTEFRLLLKALKLTYSDQRFKLYRAVDADGDNKIGRDEIDLLLNPTGADELHGEEHSGFDDHFDDGFSSHKGNSDRRASQSTRLMDRLKHEKSAAFNKSSNVQAFQLNSSNKEAGTKSPPLHHNSVSEFKPDEMV